ncbi:PAS domain S-box protein [Ferriphaselus sp. R-1]|uniref:PAS domain S-box protein n=1 Tax=Ferriphaselus sp. R-1 TaxID=1485544 RepID=UPI00068D6978|nr:PAS domain S-box protein [Ferriphaselus sp. R-1]
MNKRLLASLVLPFITCGLQWLLWDSVIKPYVWFLFFPTAFFGAWLGGIRGGLGSGMIGALLAWYVFMPPQFTWDIRGVGQIASILLFIGMSGLFGWVFERLHQTMRRMDEAKAEITRLYNNSLEAPFEQAAVGIALVAPDGHWLRINRKLCDIVGYTQQELLAMTFQDITHPDDLDADLGFMRRVLAREIDTYSMEKRYIRKDGSTIWVNLTVALLWTPEGKPDYFISVVEDISKRKAAEAAVAESANLLHATSRLAKLGHWHWDLRTDQHRWSEEIYACYGRDPSLPPAVYPEVQHYFTPESWSVLAAAVERGMATGAPYECDAEVVRPDGTHCWVTARGQAIRDSAGNVVELYGTVQDITARKEAALALLQSEQRYHLILDNAADAIFIVDVQGHYRYVNRQAQAMLGYSAEEFAGMSIRDITPDEDAAHSAAAFGELLQNGRVTTELLLKCKDGRVLPVEINAILLPDGTAYGACRDISERREFLRKMAVYQADLEEQVRLRTQALHELQGKEQTVRELAQAIEQSPESIAITDLDANLQYVNEAFVRNTGYSREEVIGKNPRILHSGKTSKDNYDALWRSLTAGQTWQGEFVNLRKDGSEYIEHAIISPLRQPDGRITHYVAVKEDVTEKKRAQAEIHRLAYYDALTGLPNRALLLERMMQTLATTRRAGHHSALIVLNIDRFKNVNDAGGPPMGDALLCAVGERLQHVLREGDVLARTAGDEFSILLTDLSPQQQNAAHYAMHVAEKLHQTLDAPFDIGAGLTITVCLGVALFPHGEGDTSLDILRRANAALHGAKARGDRQTSFFDSGIDSEAHRRFDIERGLHHALAQGELRVYLQSQVDAEGAVVGAEALVRWQHPQQGLMPPATFISIAEESNLIIEVGIWMLTEVCRIMAREEIACRPWRFSVNISPRHFRRPDFVEQVEHILRVTGADPGHLTLEVTEGMLIDNLGDIVAKMGALSARGIHFSMDDFGTGYSSLSYLKRLPIHELKIDKSFVQEVTSDASNAALVETILLVAKHMHLKVVAEGVETRAQADFLNHHGPVIHQGYLFGKPQPADVWLSKLADSAAG